MKFKEIELMALVSNELLEKSDAVVCLQGDGHQRAKYSAELFREGLAKKIIISGGLKNFVFSPPTKLLIKDIKKMGISEKNIIPEENSQNTWEQAVETLKIVKEKKWKKIIIVASLFHQPRAFLTFLMAAKKLKLKIMISNAPVKGLDWFKETPLKKTRLKLLEEEFKKIAEYQKRGHLATIQQAIEYQQQKEKQTQYGPKTS